MFKMYTGQKARLIKVCKEGEKGGISFEIVIVLDVHLVLLEPLVCSLEVRHEKSTHFDVITS